MRNDEGSGDIPCTDAAGAGIRARVKVRRSHEIHKESFTRAYKAGVKIAMGTDAGVFKHGTNLRELELMVECGMTPGDAIVAKMASSIVGLPDCTGRFHGVIHTIVANTSSVGSFQTGWK